MQQAKDLLSMAGDALRSLNPSLLSHTPPRSGWTFFHVCYLGPNGETDLEKVKYCLDLLPDQRSRVASWYIHPERHVVETTIVFLLAMTVLRKVLPTYLRNVKDIETKVREPPLTMKFLTTIMFAMHVGYKMNGSPDKWMYMTQPCNFQWIIWFALCYLPMEFRTMQICYQMIIPYVSFPMLAFIAPEERSLTLWMEGPFFYLHHAVLIGYAIFLLRSGRTWMIPEDGSSIVKNFGKQWALAFAFFALYHCFLVPFSIISGYNLSYTMSPPTHFWSFGLFSGSYYRMHILLYFAAKFFCIQLVVTVVELCQKKYAAAFGAPADLSDGKKND